MPGSFECCREKSGRKSERRRRRHRRRVLRRVHGTFARGHKPVDVSVVGGTTAVTVQTALHAHLVYACSVRPSPALAHLPPGHLVDLTLGAFVGTPALPRFGHLLCGGLGRCRAWRAGGPGRGCAESPASAPPVRPGAVYGPTPAQSVRGRTPDTLRALGLSCPAGPFDRPSPSRGSFDRSRVDASGRSCFRRETFRATG